MFTGIIEEKGEVAALVQAGGSARLSVRGPLVVSDASHGDSIAVNGVCLTVVETDGDVFTVDVMRESLDRTSLGGLKEGAAVNLERAVRADQRLGGHIVQGHVDGTAVLLSRDPGERWDDLRFSLPEPLARYVAEKGSIAIDGISLTVTTVDDDSFGVSLIPTTLELTTMGGLRVGDLVNLEVDVIAKYVERLVRQ
ncbi:riboflavin synthase [Nonomuraea roseoviolacea subsp. roseoviolacea]|uniref:Riboflavin synthase n=1 Tax=Nonomuraea roseoviolacea subsp. carminata TaxID=160689 RepID=A0ABT1JSS4_9ACTN|nr:riboflavin synthase [Nonomuraea roseoviolacea]MCP2344331.1 riboflavin synthase [Nonomuraea roseoviolacea subsp. carminata]